MPEKIIEDETAGWNIYEGEGFSINYPQEWEVKTEETIKLTYLTLKKKELKKYFRAKTW